MAVTSIGIEKGPEQLAGPQIRGLKGAGNEKTDGWYFYDFLVWTVCEGMVLGKSLEPVVEIDHPAILVNEKAPVYVLILYQVSKIEEDPSRPRAKLNLGLVIDRSGSMSGRGKLEYAKKAAFILVDNLKNSDRISIVQYDDRVDVLWPSSPVESPGIIKKRINSLSPGGSTNLTGGMMKGVDEVLGHFDKSALNRVILLSDGLANQGITNPFEIRKLVQNAKEKGVHISTMGLGSDYNEDLMQAIAENAGGNYYYIESPTQMARIFQQEMSILFATVAKGLELQFSGGDMVKEVEVFGFPFKLQGSQARIEQEDVYAGETRSVLLRLVLQPQKEGEAEVGKLKLSYVDVTDGNRKITIDKNIKVLVTPDKALVAKAENKKVTVEATLIEADKRHEDYVRQYEKGQKKQALENIRKLQQEMSVKNTTLSDTQIAKKVEALQMESEEMKSAETSRQNRAVYLKKSKQRFYQAKKGKRGKYVLQPGDSGYEVEMLQKLLRKEGIYNGPIDGRYSAELKRAIETFQRREHLDVDGIAGPRTMKALGNY